MTTDSLHSHLRMTTGSLRPGFAGPTASFVMPGHPGPAPPAGAQARVRASIPFRLSKMKRQWNGLPEPVPGLDPGIKPGNDKERGGCPAVAPQDDGLGSTTNFPALPCLTNQRLRFVFICRSPNLPLVGRSARVSRAGWGLALQIARCETPSPFPPCDLRRASLAQDRGGAPLGSSPRAGSLPQGRGECLVRHSPLLALPSQGGRKQRVSP